MRAQRVDILDDQMKKEHNYSQKVYAWTVKAIPEILKKKLS